MAGNAGGGGPGGPGGGGGLNGGKPIQEKVINGQLAAIIDGKPVVASPDLAAATVTGHSHALDNSMDAANAPDVVDKSKFGPKIGYSPHEGTYGPQYFVWGSGDGRDAPGNPYDPHKYMVSLYFGEDEQTAVGAANEYGERPETRGPEVDFSTASKITELGNTGPVDAKDKTNDPNRFSRKGAVYYDRRTGLTIRRNTDSTGTLTDLPAKDTMY
jgi:hypothetical protein